MNKEQLLQDMEPIRKNLESLQLGCVRDHTSTVDYRSVDVYPSTSELVFPSDKKIPCNVIKGPFKNTYEYLNTHFSLLREDFIKPIRENVISFLTSINQKLPFVKIHEVQVIRKGVKNSDTCLCFEIKKGITYFSWNIKRDSKRFMLGSLLIFSKDNFKTSFCGRVADNRHILYRKVLVSFDKPIKFQYEQNYMMVECTTFFEPYFHVLNVLQSISHNSLSMQKYLIEAKSSIEMPKYLNGIKKTVSDPELNRSQLVAMNAALSQELVIIQGPPGTGKTFLGLRIAQELLSTSKNWCDETPMLIVSYTNHALDQFLEGLADSTDKILRFGGQSKNPKMKNFSIRECRRRYYESSPSGCLYKQQIGPLFREYCTIEKEILFMGNQMDNITTSNPTCIFYFNILATGVPEMEGFFSSERHDELVSWLLEEDGTVVEENGAHSAFDVTSTKNLHCDSKRMAEVYRVYLKDFHKVSKYCMISVSIIETATQKLHDRITEITAGIEKQRKKYESAENLKLFRYYLRGKKREVEKLSEAYNYLVRKLQYLKICLKTDFNNNVDRKKVDMQDPFKMPVYVRWQLYKYWLRRYEIYMKEQMDTIIDEYKAIYEEFNEVQEKNNLKVMRKQKIIGMTTTSAARLHSTIKALKCPIVIVEEAAEVLEAHIIPVLTEHCQHLILIGDHQQLKPSTADYDIETRYKLGVSLFERMVINNIQCNTLNVQHRMRPEISRLVTPSIYPVLYNHESVENFSPINGMDKCVYFLTHNEPEQGSGDSSKKNMHEAKFLIQLAVYLLKNGYKSEEITILTAYLGQVWTLLQEQRECANQKVKQVKITSVDNFQGEENKIILLSLVRNNPRNKIGFLSIENRVCVALSRAKEGMYVMGNMRQLSSCSQLWRKIKLSFEAQEALGTFISLKCQQHGEITKVRNAEDFNNMVPNGGCSQICNKCLSCGHKCQRHCHNDDLLHTEYKCREPCLRSACGNISHKCRKQCYQDCALCTHRLPRKQSCGHHIKCFMEEMEDYRCQEVVYVRLSCGHKFPVTCNEYDSDAEENIECSACKIGQEAKDAPDTDNEKDLEEIVNYIRNMNILDTSSDGESDIEIEIPEKLDIHTNNGTCKREAEAITQPEESEEPSGEELEEFSNRLEQSSKQELKESPREGLKPSSKDLEESLEELEDSSEKEWGHYLDKECRKTPKRR